MKIKFAIEKKFFNSRINMLNGLIAQLVEQLTLNQLVEGSNPSEPKIDRMTSVILSIFV